MNPSSHRDRLPAASSSRRLLLFLLGLLGVAILGASLFVATVKVFFAIDISDQILCSDIESVPSLAYNNTTLLGSTSWVNGIEYAYERIPRIIHQTWKTEHLPPNWAVLSDECRLMHPDYQYILWTDETARELIAEHYDWFLPTYDGYPHNIQRADALRYFVLYHYGGLYMDLDIGCRRPMDPLLRFPTLLAVTKPVGVSNDLMFSEPRGAFMGTVIRDLSSFDHNYHSSYISVMFSTGPMMLSAMLSQYNSLGSRLEDSRVRLLPRSLYGKNIAQEDAPSAFFSHHYGSSWHGQDAFIFTYLGKYGFTAAVTAVALLGLVLASLLWQRRATVVRQTILRHWYDSTTDIHDTINHPRISTSKRLSAEIV